MYSCEFYFHLTTDHGWATLTRRLDLPFVPHASLHVAFPGDDEEGDEILRVTWLADEQRFVCELETDDVVGLDDWNLEECMAHYEAEGWSAEKRGSNRVRLLPTGRLLDFES